MLNAPQSTLRMWPCFGSWVNNLRNRRCIGWSNFLRALCLSYEQKTMTHVGCLLARGIEIGQPPSDILIWTLMGDEPSLAHDGMCITHANQHPIVVPSHCTCWTSTKTGACSISNGWNNQCNPSHVERLHWIQLPLMRFWHRHSGPDHTSNRLHNNYYRLHHIMAWCEMHMSHILQKRNVNNKQFEPATCHSRTCDNPRWCWPGCNAFAMLRGSFWPKDKEELKSTFIHVHTP